MPNSWPTMDSLSPLQVLLITIATLTLILLASLVTISRRAGLDHIPGPFLAKYTNAWSAYYAIQLSRARSGVAVAEFGRGLQRKYGSATIRTGPRTVTILDPAALHLVYGVRGKLDKSDSYAPFRMTGVPNTLVAIPDEKTHSKYRKLVADTYTMTALKGYEPYIDEVITRWLGVFDRFATSGDVMNISLWSHYFCFDNVSMLSIGKPLGFLEGRDAFNMIKATTFFTWYICLASHMPWIHKIFQDNFVMRKLIGPPPIAAFAEQVVRERLAQKPPATSDDGEPKRPDFLSNFIALHNQNPTLMDEKQITIMVVGNLLAGSLSPSTALKELTRFLATTTSAQEKIFAELQTSNPTKTASNPPPSFTSLKDLPYLTGTIREALRLHPQIVVRQERLSPSPGGLTLPDNIYLPPGTKIGALGQAMTLNCVDTDDFVPERWMRREDETGGNWVERKARMERTDMTFGQGSRASIGRNVTLLEIYKAVGAVVSRYRFESVEGRVEVGRDCWVRVYRREKGR